MSGKSYRIFVDPVIWLQKLTSFLEGSRLDPVYLYSQLLTSQLRIRCDRSLGCRTLSGCQYVKSSAS